MDRGVFFTKAKPLFGHYDQPQVDGINIILDEAVRRSTPVNWLAYILATTFHETNRTFLPVREAYFVSKNFTTAEAWRKKHLRYYPYYGRGYVQLTWDYNYRKAGAFVGVDLLTYPERALEPEFAVEIMFEGMEKGWFGKAMSKSIDLKDDPDGVERKEYLAARTAVNGHDEAAKIADYALSFERCLRQAKYDVAPVSHPDLPVPVVPTIDAKPALNPTDASRAPSMNIGGS